MVRSYRLAKLQLEAVLPGIRHRQYSTPPAGHDVSEQLREVMRNVPQPVAIAVTQSSPSTSYHGATLSSFTSLTLHPHPLVAFSLRLPSRLADHLRSTPSKPLTISLLSQIHADIASRLARPGTDQSGLFDPGAGHFDTSSPPALRDGVGVLRCQVVSSTTLRDICSDEEVTQEVEEAGLREEPIPATPPPSGVRDKGEQQAQIHGSELFICRVMEVEGGHGESASKPMLYYRQRYTSVKDV